MDDNKIISWIMKTKFRRWVLFLPIAIILSLLSNIIWETLNAISMGRMISTDSFLYNIYNIPISGLLAGFIFVYVGGYIAPNKYGRIFLIILIIILSLLVAIRDIRMVDNMDYWTSLFSIFLVIGAFSAQNYLKNEKR